MTEATYSPEGKRVEGQALPASSGPKPQATKSHFPPAQQPQTKRAEETRDGRRRRKDSGPLSGLKLAVPAELKEAGFEYRWINEDGRRIHGKTVEDDWDIVRSKTIEGTGEGTPVSRIVGKDASGQPINAFLCRKPEQFYREDKQKEQRVVDEREAAIRRGASVSPEGLSGPNAYVPEGGIHIGN